MGLNFEIFTSNALKTTWKDTLSNFKNNVFSATEISPTKYLLSEKKFKNYDLIYNQNLSKIRLTVDTPDDFKAITKIFERIYSNNQFFT